MSGDIYANNAIIAEMLAGRRPEWFEQDHDQTMSESYPQSTSWGISLQGSVTEGTALKTHVAIDNQYRLGYHSARFTVVSFDYSASYKLTIGGSTTTFDAAAAGVTTDQEVLEGIKLAVEAIAPVWQCEIVDYDNDGVPESLVVNRTDGGEFPTGEFSATGAGEMEVYADTRSAKIDTFVLTYGKSGPARKPDRWRKIEGYSGITADHNYTDVWDTLDLCVYT